MSNNLRGYYWAVIVPAIAKAQKISPDTAHRKLKSKFLQNPFAGTKAISDQQLQNYHLKIREWAKKEYEIDIPLPTA